MVGFDPEDFDYSRDLVLWSLERSLRRLRVPKLSLAQIHEVNWAGWERIMEPGGALGGLREAQKQGLCERIGLTGRAIPLLAQLAATGEFDAVLVYRDYHPCSQLAAQSVIPKAHEQDMGIVAAMPLANGLFADEPRTQRALEALHEEERREAERVLQILDGLPGTLAQNSFQYILADLRVSTVCGGPASVDELVDIAGASEMGPLSQSSLEELGGLNSGRGE